MAQKKGKTGNPNGRPKGTPNKVTSEMKTWLAGLIDDNRWQMESDLKQLEPKDRLFMLEKLMQYVVPKQQSVAAQIDLYNLSSEQLDIIIEKYIPKARVLTKHEACELFEKLENEY